MRRLLFSLISLMAITNVVFASKTYAHSDIKTVIAEQDIKVVRLDYQSESEIPAELRPIVQHAFSKKDNNDPQISLYFSLVNDFNFLRAVGVKRQTDDFGRTHGTEFKIIGKLNSTDTLTLSYTTDLYTKPVSKIVGTNSVDSEQVFQKFTDENILKLIYEHHPENKIYYWRAEAGWHELNREYRGRFFDSSAQQKQFHEAVNMGSGGDRTKDVTFLNESAESEEGAMVALYAGLMKTFFDDNDWCRKSLRSEIGRFESSLHNADMNSTKISAALDCKFADIKNRFMLEVGYEAVQHNGGLQKQQYFDFSTKRKRWKYGFRIENPNGELINHVDYNLPNIDDGKFDPIFRMYLQHDVN